MCGCHVVAVPSLMCCVHSIAYEIHTTVVTWITTTARPFTIVSVEVNVKRNWNVFGSIETALQLCRLRLALC